VQTGAGGEGGESVREVVRANVGRVALSVRREGRTETTGNSK